MSKTRSTFVRTNRAGHSYLVAQPVEKKVCGVMVFLHGAAGFAGYMSDLMRYFVDRGFVCYAPDIIGHGERGHLDISQARLHDYVLDMQDFILQVVVTEWKEVILVGHSMGGAIAQKLSENSFVRATILITPAPPKGVPFWPGGVLHLSVNDFFGAIGSVMTKSNFTPSRGLIESLFADPEASRGIIDKWTKNRVANESIKVLMELGLSRVAVDREQISGPILVIGARRDKVIHHSVATAIDDYYGEQSTLVMLEDLGHMCPFEAGWEQTAKVMEEWLKKKLKK